jgi:hypothetical protein
MKLSFDGGATGSLPSQDMVMKNHLALQSFNTINLMTQGCIHCHAHLA